MSPRSAFLTVALLVVLVGPYGKAYAATITVNTPLDVIADDGLCSLREAITAANTDTASGASGGECPAGTGDDTITLPAGSYNLSIVGAGEDINGTGDLDIQGNLTINGIGSANTIIDGGGLDRVFQVSSGVTVEISGVTIRNGDGGNDPGGGGILNDGTVTLTNSRVSGNTVDVAAGGGILNNGTLALSNSSVSGNAADELGDQGGGGGISNFGTLTLLNSTVSDNIGGDEGGGLHQDSGGTLTLTNSTVSGNVAVVSDGGGIAIFSGTLTITNTNVNGNSTGGSGGGIWIGGGIANVANTMIARNLSGGDCTGSIASLGHNLDSDGTCNLTQPTDLSNTDPLLGPLRDNGGPTLTHALLPGSPAIDAGNPATPGSGGTACETTDQRGVARPKGTRCDIGAYEFDPANPPTVPSLSQWAFLGLAAALAGLAYLRLRQRRLGLLAH